MSESLITPDKQNPFLSGIEVYRPVLNIDQKSVDQFNTRVDNFNYYLWEEGIFANQAKVVVHPNSVALILGPGEVRRVQELVGVEPTKEENHQLARWLSRFLPNSIDDELKVPTRPINEARPDKHNQLIFTIATNNPDIREERREAKKLVSLFYKIGELGISRNEAWIENRYKTDVLLARISKVSRHIATIKPFRDMLDHELGLLPQEIQLGVAIINEIEET